jgi:hypothetical protein
MFESHRSKEISKRKGRKPHKEIARYTKKRSTERKKYGKALDSPTSHKSRYAKRHNKSIKRDVTKSDWRY